jgi:addiction module HigA family antidote
MSRSSTNTKRRLAPVHPGEILLEEFLAPLGLTQYRLAKSLSVPPPTYQ